MTIIISDFCKIQVSMHCLVEERTWEECVDYGSQYQ